MRLTPALQQFANDLQGACQAGRFICLYPHVGADGGALGASFALALALERLGAETAIALEEAIPPRFALLPPLRPDQLVIAPETPQQLGPRGLDVGFAVDSPGGKRLGQRLPLYEASATRLLLDHHLPDPVDAEPLCCRPGDAECRYWDTQAAATCELVTLLLLYLEAETGTSLIDVGVATALMLGLVTDTGRFSHANTTARSLEVAALLRRREAPLPALIYEQYEALSPLRFRLLGLMGEATEFFYDGRLALLLVPHAQIEAMGAIDADFDGISAQMRNVHGVGLALLLREVKPGEWRGSVRSEAPYRAQQVAKALGGGGHLLAAGFSFTGSADSLLERVHEEACRELQAHEVAHG